MKFGITVDYYEGSKIEVIYFKKNKGITQAIYIDGKKTSENKVYKVNSEKPYTRFGGRYWYITGDELNAMKSVI